MNKLNLLTRKASLFLLLVTFSFFLTSQVSFSQNNETELEIDEVVEFDFSELVEELSLSEAAEAISVITEETAITSIKFNFSLHKGTSLKDHHYTKEHDLSIDSTGAISFVFGQEEVEQILLNGLNENPESFQFRFEILPLASPIQQIVYVDKIEIEEIFVKDTIFIETTIKEFTKDQEKEHEKRLGENLKKEKKTGLIPYYSEADTSDKQAYILIKRQQQKMIGPMTYEEHLAYEKRLAEEQSLLAKAEKSKAAKKAKEKSKAEDASKGKGKKDKMPPLESKELKPTISIRELMAKPGITTLQYNLLEATETKIDFLVDQFNKLIDIAVEKAYEMAADMAKKGIDMIPGGVGTMINGSGLSDYALDLLKRKVVNKAIFKLKEKYHEKINVLIGTAYAKAFGVKLEIPTNVPTEEAEVEETEEDTLDKKGKKKK